MSTKSQWQQAKITNSTIAFIVLWNGRFTHRGRVNGEPSTLYEVPNFFHDVMANRTCIDEDDYLWTGLLHKLLDLIKNKLLFS
jgi:hypothetical protein